jgi:hypothetical protein
MAVLWRLRTILSLPSANLSEADEKRRQRLLTLLPTESVLGVTAEGRSVQDRKLAFDMAKEADKRGANVAGNKLDKGEQAFNDDFPAPKPVGVSMGGYGPQDVTEGKATDRPSMPVITMEVGGKAPSSKVRTPTSSPLARWSCARSATSSCSSSCGLRNPELSPRARR